MHTNCTVILAFRQIAIETKELNSPLPLLLSPSFSFSWPLRCLGRVLLSRVAVAGNGVQTRRQIHSGGDGLDVLDGEGFQDVGAGSFG